MIRQCLVDGSNATTVSIRNLCTEGNVTGGLKTSEKRMVFALTASNHTLGLKSKLVGSRMGHGKNEMHSLYSQQ